MKRHAGLRTIAALWILLLAEGAWQLGWEAVGSGPILRRFSPRWFTVLAGYGVLGGLSGLAALWALWRPRNFQDGAVAVVEAGMERLGRFRWPLIGVLVVAPAALFLGPMPWLFGVAGLRAVLLLAFATLAGLAVPSHRITRGGRLAFALLTSVAIFVLAREFIQVTGYPFKLFWSEGNRLWDYSLYFGTERFAVAGDFTYPSYMAPGRHGLWGLAYLVPATPIWLIRLWDAVLWTLPYVALGWMAVARGRKVLPTWIVSGFVAWAFLFLAQGPILPPLILSAVIALALYDSKRPWRTAGAAAVGCLYAGLSRWTWMFAPAIWVGLLFFLDKPRQLSLRSRLSGPVLIGAAGLIGALGSRLAMDLIHPRPGPVYATAFSQGLLWYRLLPSASNPYGLLLGLVVTCLPLVGLLAVALRRGWIRWDGWQLAGAGAALAAFLSVGLVASVKIGGGNNLHNLDMFFVALVTLGGWGLIDLAKRGQWDVVARSPAVRTFLALAVIVPTWWLVKTGGPLDVADWRTAQDSLEALQEEVRAANRRGPVLFIDQRQLFTFGHLEDVPLVMDYEMKNLMNQALAENEPYLRRFEQDLAEGRFSMVIAEPQKIQYQGRSAAFGEENDAWVRHVSVPLLEHYRPELRLPEVEVWGMVPVEKAGGGTEDGP